MQLSGHMALQELQNGNRRFVEGKQTHPEQTGWDREALVDGQSPSAVVVGCSDSRVPPSLVFDQGLGFIFEVRTPGHIIDDVALGSIEYAVSHLGTQLVLVLGHSGCGAVSFVMEGGEAEGNLGRIAQLIHSVIAWADGGDAEAIDVETVEEAVEANVRGAVAQIRAAEPVIKGLVEEDEVLVVGAVYDLATGVVTLLE